MKSRKHNQRYLWLLSGTGEGPELCKALNAQGWNVTVSVVSEQASYAYKCLPLHDLQIGALKGPAAIKSLLENARSIKKKFELVVDATHPFASVITKDLLLACKELQQPLLRFERLLEAPSDAKYIKNISELSAISAKGAHFLFAIGSRQLGEAVYSIRLAGAKAFARVLDRPESLRLALSSGLESKHIAVLNPLAGDDPGSFEEALCRRWSITDVVCRQSGGVSQKLWQDVSRKYGLNLWLVSRPHACGNMESASNLEELLRKTSDYI